MLWKQKGDPKAMTTSAQHEESPPAYRRLDWHDFGVTYIDLDHGAKPEHAHSTLQVSVPLRHAVLSAEWQSSSGRKQAKALAEGEVCVIPSWQPHTIRWGRRSEWVSFHLEPAFMERAAHDLRAGGEVHVSEQFGRRDCVIQWLGGTLRTELRHVGTPSRLYIESLACVLAVHLLRQCSAFDRTVRKVSGGLPPCKLRRTLEYINDNLAGALTLTEVAASVGLSPYHFARTFKQATGCAPHKYVMGQRIERAKRLLAETDLQIADVALRVGCQSQSQLTTLLRRYAGTTPRAYRNATRS